MGEIFFFVILLITTYLIWRYYWKIQSMYNSSTLSFYTPDTFPVLKEHEESYDYYTNYGFRTAKNKTLVICVLLRDASNKIPEIQKRAERVGRMFRDYRIVIVENDSTDGTRSKLKDWRRSNPRVILLGCGINSDVDECRLPKAAVKTDGHGVDRRRIEKMTHLRNIYLDYVKNHLSVFDFAVVWDMDIIGTVYLDGIANTMGYFLSPNSPILEADAICAYGIYRWGFMTLYYDTYAHIDKEDVFHIDLKTVHDLKKGLGIKYKRGTPPVPVVSCFSGFTIYRISSLVGAQYDMSPPDNLECEHVRLHRHLGNVYLNPSMIHFVLYNE